MSSPNIEDDLKYCKASGQLHDLLKRKTGSASREDRKRQDLQDQSKYILLILPLAIFLILSFFSACSVLSMVVNFFM